MWTRHDVSVIPVRLTEQALRRVVDVVASRLTIVTSTVSHVPRVCEALRRVGGRGCTLRTVLETPDDREGEDAYNTVVALDPAVGERASICG